MLNTNDPPLSLDDAMVAQAFAAAFAEMKRVDPARPTASGTLAIDPDRVEHDLARLVLTLVEFLRRLLELQAVRRMEAGSLTPDQEENVGLTLMRARDKVLELAKHFGLEERDLTLQLGPLGRLM